MTYAEWNKLDNRFQDMLLKAYHAWRIGNESDGAEDKEIAKSLVDKHMSEAYTIRSKYINAKVEV